MSVQTIYLSSVQLRYWGLITYQRPDRDKVNSINHWSDIIRHYLTLSHKSVTSPPHWSRLSLSFLSDLTNIYLVIKTAGRTHLWESVHSVQSDVIKLSCESCHNKLSNAAHSLGMRWTSFCSSLFFPFQICGQAEWGWWGQLLVTLKSSPVLPIVNLRPVKVSGPSEQLVVRERRKPLNRMCRIMREDTTTAKSRVRPTLNCEREIIRKMIYLKSQRLCRS